MNLKNNVTPTYKNLTPMPEIKPARTTFTKADLRSGDVVVMYNGDVQIVCLETASFICQTNYDNLDYINQDLSNKLNNDHDIIEVYRPTNGYYCQFNPNAYKKAKLMYKRQDKKKMTILEIEKELGYPIEVEL